MTRTTRKLSAWVKGVVVLLWIILFGLLLERDVFIATVNYDEMQTLKQAELEEYLSILFKGKKIGYVMYRYRPTDNGTWLLQQHAKMNLNVAGMVQMIEMELDAHLSAHNILQSFTFHFASPFYQMDAKGEVTDNTVRYHLQTAASSITDQLTLSSPPLLATSRRGYLLQEGIEPGQKRRIPWFDPVSMTGKESVLEYRGKESVLINGRVHKLHRFIESFSGARVSFWLNDEGVVVREESPAGFVFQKEPKFKALALDEADDEILSAVAVQIIGEMVSGDFAQRRYRLHLEEAEGFDLDGGRQEYQDTILTLTKENMDDEELTTPCRTSQIGLDATAYIQADHEKIVTLAEEITAGTDNSLDHVRLLSAWVYENLEKRAVLGLPDALTTLQNRQGDCNEHAALFAALARAKAIPTRIASGVTYHEGAFYYHAWNEVCLGKQWISIDTTTNQFPADLTHLRFVYGELQEQVRISGLLGTLLIEPLTATPSSKPTTTPVTKP